MAHPAAAELFIHHRRQKLPLTPPPEWTLLAFAAPGEGEEPPDLRPLVLSRLRDPLEAPPLRDLVSSARRVAVLVEDLTRHSPKEILLSAVLAELADGGVTDDRIDVVVALGSHRPLADAELAGCFGAETVSRYRFVNHDPRAPDLVEVGRTGAGHPVRINRTVAEADRVIGIGSICPHPMNGFGGGSKILFPGVADLDSILEHHLRLTFAPGTGLGSLDGNRFYREVEAISEGNLDFIVNSVLGGDDRARDVVAGHPAAAHRAGVEGCRAAMAFDFPAKADLTLTTSFPYTDGPQVVKPLIPAALVTQEGGTIIWAVDSDTGLPEPFLEAMAAFHRNHGNDLLQGVLDHFENQRLIMAGGAIDFNMALGLVLALQHRFTIILLSRDLTADQARRMGVHHAARLTDALAMAAGRHPAPAVNVIPYGGVVLPS